jgi:hypothetical protein
MLDPSVKIMFSLLAVICSICSSTFDFASSFLTLMFLMSRCC